MKGFPIPLVSFYLASLGRAERAKGGGWGVGGKLRKK